MTTAHVAARGYEAQLETELTARHGGFERHGERLYLVEGPALPVAWAVNTWFDVERLTITSIGQAAAQLRERGPYWGVHEVASRRRMQLIADKLLKIKDRPLAFPLQRALKARGAFTLLDDQTLLCARQTSRPFPDGVFPFIEDHENPPARAYMKCWEVLSLLGDAPGPGDQVLELGAAPGAWTWSLAELLGAEVRSIDRAPLDPRIDALPNVHHELCSAFGIEPYPIDWLFSDVICYPERLLTLIDRWRSSGHCEKFVITIKFQGETDHEAVRRFQELPDVHVLHLNANKHELTVIIHPDLRGSSPQPWPWVVEA